MTNYGKFIGDIFIQTIQMMKLKNKPHLSKIEREQGKDGKDKTIN